MSAVTLGVSNAATYCVVCAAVLRRGGCVHFAAGSPLQARIVDQAKGAPNLASTLNQGAFNLGNALGASLGGIMLTAGIGYRYLSLGSAAVASVALMVALVALRMEQKENGAAAKKEMVSA